MTFVRNNALDVPGVDWKQRDHQRRRGSVEPPECSTMANRRESQHPTPGLLYEDYLRATIKTCHSCLSHPGALVRYGPSVARLTFIIRR